MVVLIQRVDTGCGPGMTVDKTGYAILMSEYLLIQESVIRHGKTCIHSNRRNSGGGPKNIHAGRLSGQHGSDCP